MSLKNMLVENQKLKKQSTVDENQLDSQIKQLEAQINFLSKKIEYILSIRERAMNLMLTSPAFHYLLINPSFFEKVYYKLIEGIVIKQKVLNKLKKISEWKELDQKTIEKINLEFLLELQRLDRKQENLKKSMAHFRT